MKPAATTDDVKASSPGPTTATDSAKESKPSGKRKRRGPKIAFIGWNPAQFLHYAPIAALMPRAIYVIEERPEGKGFDFMNLPDAPARIRRLSPESLRSIDGRFDVIVCQSPFAGMENLRRTRLAMLQAGYARGSWNFAPWRSMADLCLTMGNHATRKLGTYAPCVRIGNPRYAQWGKQEFQQAAAAKYTPLLDPRKKTLLYAPTWGEECGLKTYAAALSALGRDYNVICHLHPRGEIGSRGELARLRQCFTLVFGSRDDIAELLVVADVLITDASGSMFEALYCRKPVILLETGHPGAMSGSDDLEYARRSELGRQVQTPAELAPTVLEVLVSWKSDFQQEALRDDLFCDPAGSAPAAKKALLGLVARSLAFTDVQQTLRATMRASFQREHELRISRTWQGFLNYQLAAVRTLARKRLFFLKPVLPDLPPPAPQTALSAPASVVPSIDGRVIHLHFDTPPAEILSRIRAPHVDGPPDFVHVSLGSECEPGGHLQKMAATHPAARACIVTLSSAGYYTYETAGGITRAIREERIPQVWHPVVKGIYQVNGDGLVHTVTPPLNERKAERLLVVFSSMDSACPDLGRFFVQDFPTVQKYIPPGTAVLRIADIGGVIGAFYLDTTHRPDFTGAIQNLIHATAGDLGIDHDSIVLFGFSKGGTGAIYHGMRGGYRFVSGDPVLSDDDFENDPYFALGGAYPEQKSRVFARLFDQIETDDRAGMLRGRAAVVCSDRSALFPFLTTALVNRFGDRMTILNSQNPLITGHVGLGQLVLNSLTMLLNMQLYGMKLPEGLHNID